MPLIIGDRSASTGMAKAIYDQLRAVMEPGLGELDASALNAMRESWKKMAFAISKGVIDHIKTNMEIFGIETQGDVNTSVKGNTGTGHPNNHYHNVDLNGEEEDVLFVQSNDGTGHVK
jgi:hypothetical protein